MGGFGVLAWLAVGVAGGWTISRLMVGAEDDALRGTAAGMVGAILGGLGMRLLEPSPALEANTFSTSVAALAGSLWLTWITCVLTTGRQRGLGRPPEVRFTRSDATAESAQLGHADGARPLTYAAARDRLVEQLRRDAVAHDAGRYDEIGQSFDSVDGALAPEGAPEFRKLVVAMAFWDGWIDARNRGWEPDGGIARAEWPVLARTVAGDLEGGRDVTDTRVVTRFDTAVYPSLGHRMQALAARLRAG